MNSTNGERAEKTPAVSIVIPTYKRDETLRRAIEGRKRRILARLARIWKVGKKC